MLTLLKILLPIYLVLIQTGGISIESKVDKSVITIGDLIKYEIIVKRDKNLKVEMPVLASNLGYFEIRDYKVYEPVKINDKIEDRVEYIITTYDTGKYVIPPISVYYTGVDSIRKELKTQEITINVRSVKPSEAKDIKGLKPPAELKRNLKRIIYLSSAGLLLLLLVAFLYYYFKKKKKGESIIPVKKAPPRPAHEIAIESLNRLQKSKLLEQGKVKEYYTELSDIIRTYIDGRYFIPAMEMTTSEIINSLEKSGVEDGVSIEMRAFLNECDFVKFAKYIPSQEEIDNTTKRALKIIESTKIVLVQSEEEKNT